MCDLLLTGSDAKLCSSPRKRRAVSSCLHEATPQRQWCKPCVIVPGVVNNFWSSHLACQHWFRHLLATCTSSSGCKPAVDTQLLVGRTDLPENQLVESTLTLDYMLSFLWRNCLEAVELCSENVCGKDVYGKDDKGEST